MEKFVLASSGKEVKMGDILVKYEEVDSLLGKLNVVHKIIVNEDTITELLKSGIIKPVKDKSPEVPMDLIFYIGKVADKFGDMSRAIYFYDRMYLSSPAVALSLILREVAIEIDKKYKDHIQNSPEIYSISTTNGTICKVNKSHIKNYRNFAAFRTIEDAKLACKIVKPLLKRMFSGK